MQANKVLSANHLKMLREESGISDAVIEARGYWSATKKGELKGLGFSDAQCRVPALVCPIHSVTGEVALHQIRPNDPRADKDGKAVKYETPSKARIALDVPPAVRQHLGNPNRPLFITEGIRKADSAVSHGLCCIALLGVWSWRGSNVEGGKLALPDWEYIALNDREVFIVFDSDVMLKPEVYTALGRLKKFLESRSSLVKVIYLEPKTDGSKVGLDDFLAAGHTVAALTAKATDKLRSGPEAEHGFPYRETPHGLVWLKPTRDGVMETPLCNFTARILSDVIEDDGVETRRAFEIEVQQGERRATVKLSAERFAGMTWSAEALGSHAILAPGQSSRDHARVAVQLFSQDSTERHVYAHMGWRKIGERWCYLHAGGAIGPNGAESGIEVAVPAGLDRYLLPDPPEGQALQDAIRSSLRLLQVAPGRVTFSVYAALWRTVLGETDFSLHLVGHTGAGKTEIATLIQQHHGATLDARHLPASWSSTGNSLEGVAFTVKDGVLVVDDFAPSGSIHDIQRYHREADRILRAQGNRAGRQRMRADTSLRAAKPPRGLILSTGEDVPRGQSLRSRLLVAEVSPADVDWRRMTCCQSDAAAGLYAQALAVFVRWVAGRYETLKATLRETVAQLRAKIQAEHKRTPDIIANLAAGFHVFLDFAIESGAILQSAREALWQQAWNAFTEAATVQVKYQGDSDPARRFIELLVAALASGRAHLAASDGSAPSNAQAWGWEQRTSGDWQHASAECHARGSLIGWIEEADVYLEPEAAFATVQRLATEQGEALPVSGQTLRKRLREREYLASWDAARETTTVRRILGGQQRSVLHLCVAALYGLIKPDKPDIAPFGGEDGAEPPEYTTEKPDIGQGQPDKPDIDPTSERQTKSNGYAPNVGNVGFSAPLEGSREQKNDKGGVNGKTDVGNVGFSQNQNPTSEEAWEEEV